MSEQPPKASPVEAVATAMIARFVAAGYEQVSPPILQPADAYLDVIGEALRGRSYVFSDAEGDELCLRPDLTVPTCRLHLERKRKPGALAKYCYDGPAFRFQSAGVDPTRPREFRQVGIELFNAPDPGKADAEVMALTLAAVRELALPDLQLQLGDLGLFHSLLDAIDMPERWRERLRRELWQPASFRAELQLLCRAPSERARGLPPALLAELGPKSADTSEEDAAPDEEAMARAEEIVARHLEREDVPLVGARTLGEIARSLGEIASDATAEPLSASAAALIESYVGIAAPPKAAGARIADLMGSHAIDIAGPLETYRRRLDLLQQAGIDLSRVEFSAEFGRELQYYTGFVFQLQVPGQGRGGQIAGGGRYDGLLSHMGSPEPVPAVGAAIHADRLVTLWEASR